MEKYGLSYVRDEDTGHTTGYEKEGVDRLLRHMEAAERQKEGYRQQRELEQAKMRDQRHFLMVYDEGGKIMGEQQLSDLGVLFKLTTALDFDSEGLLVQSKGKDGKTKPLNKAALTKLLGKSKNGVNAAIERLEGLGALVIDKEGRSPKYYINESLIRYGKNTGKKQEFAKVYKTKAQQLLNKLTDTEAGFIFKCLPYLHYSMHALVLNPHEKNLSEVQPIRGAQLAEILGMERQSLNNLASQIKRKGAIMFIDVGTEGKGYVLNPSLCDRGFRSEYTEKVQAYFEVFEDKKKRSNKGDE